MIVPPRLRELLLLDELAGQILGIFGMGLWRDEIFQLARRKNTAVGQLLHELFQRDGHSPRL